MAQIAFDLAQERNNGTLVKRIIRPVPEIFQMTGADSRPITQIDEIEPRREQLYGKSPCSRASRALRERLQDIDWMFSVAAHV